MKYQISIQSDDPAEIANIAQYLNNDPLVEIVQPVQQQPPATVPAMPTEQPPVQQQPPATVPAMPTEQPPVQQQPPATVQQQPPATVPAMPTEQPPVQQQQPATTGELDAAGFPWDARIHASTKTQTAKNVWRNIRSVDKELVKTVEAEYRNANPVQQQQPAMQQMPTEQPPVQQQQQQMPTEQPPVQQQQPATTGELDFHTFMQKLSAQMQQRDQAGNPLVNAEYLATVTNEIATAFNMTLTAITDISTNPQMINYAVQLLQRDGKWV